jgi:hypothetical protein
MLRRWRIPAGVAILTLFAMIVGMVAPVFGDTAAQAADPYDEIIARAKIWVERGVPYSWTTIFQGYRADCSGYVSYAWGLPTPGFTTDTLRFVAAEISKDQLRPGDIMNNRGVAEDGHTVIFAGWADASKTRYNAYEQSPAVAYGSKAHFATNIPYPFWDSNGGAYVPMRLKKLASGVPVASPVAGTTDRAEPAGQIAPLSVNRGDRFSIWITLKNTGNTTWSAAADYHLANINGSPFGLSPRQNVNGNVPPNGQFRWNIEGMTAPAQPGEYWTWWTLRRGAIDIGTPVGVKVLVRPPVATGPGGNWVAPDGDRELGGPVNVSFFAYDRDGAAANISKVEFNVRTNGVWKTERTLSPSNNKPDNPTFFSFTWNAANLPEGAVSIGFDVYDKSGKVARSADGVKKLRDAVVSMQVDDSSGNPRFFPETGYRISDDRFWDYFQKRGGLRTFGYPVSRKFTLLGTEVQVFQRKVMQKGPGGIVTLLNLLDSEFLPYLVMNGATTPSKDEALVAKAPSPGSPNYASGILEYILQASPNSWNDLAVNFYRTFSTTVGLDDACSDGSCGPGQLPALNMELWGVPLSAPAIDPKNHDFVYQRFQRGIMHYDKGTGLTQGLLLGDLFKSLITGQRLASDLDTAAAKSRFYRQYVNNTGNGLARPGELPGTDMSNAFEPDE